MSKDLNSVKSKVFTRDLFGISHTFRKFYHTHFFIQFTNYKNN